MRLKPHFTFNPLFSQLKLTAIDVRKLNLLQLTLVTVNVITKDFLALATSFL